jgi:diguanylate cyclase (GGDEF)-like protein
MNNVLLLCDGVNARTDFLTALIEKKYTVEVLSDADAVIEAIRSRSEAIYALMIDHPAGNPRAGEVIDFVQSANSYLFAIPILALTEPAFRDDDEAFLSDTVIATIEIGQSERAVNHKIRKANDTINTFSFQEFSRMLKALPSLIYLKDAKARYVFCSQYWHHLAHYDEANWSIAGKTDLEIRKDTANAQAAFESDMRIIESGVGGSYVIEENDDGYQEFLQIIKEPVRDADGKVRGIIAIINNVTEQETLRRELKKKSITDELTGLYNRAYFDEFTARLGDDVFPLGIISADCDGLKTINDLYGHPMGDEYIRMTATLLKSELPPETTLFRTGGDEFLALLPRTDDAAMAQYGSKLKAAEKMFSIKDRSLSVSIGVGVMRGDGDTLQSAVEKSDKEMYKHKRSKMSWM